MHVSRTAWSWTLLGVLTCAGCDHALPVALPRCMDGQGLGTDAAGNFQCTELHRAALAIRPLVPGCVPGQVLTYGSDTLHLTCSDKLPLDSSAVSGDALRQHIVMLENKVDSLRATLARLQPMLGSKEPLYVGSTSVATTGRITSVGSTGLLAANTLCAAQFGAKAHMCTQFQLTRTVAVGKLGPKQL